MTRFVLALDQGTTSSRSILFDHDGSIVATAQREFTQHFPRPGWVEHDAEEIWATQAATIAEVLARARATVDDVVAVGITNQRETTVLWERASGRPVAPAIVWQDRRTADFCARLKSAGHEPEIARRTGLLLDPYFSGTKLAWLLDSEPGLRARAERGELAFGTIDSWLAWKLSRGTQHITDATNASRTLLLDIATGTWDDYALELLRIPRALLPRVVPSMLARGEAFALLGGREIPLGGIAGDQQAALFGQACFRPGMAKNTYGTGCFMLMNTGREPQPSANRLLTTVAGTAQDDTTRSKARCSLAARWCNGCATGSGSSRSPPTSRRSPRPSTTQAGSTSSRHSRDSAARTGIRTRAARWSVCHAARPRRTSRARHSSPSRSRARKCCSRCSATRGSHWSSCASTAARPPTTS
jgi:glycerol kinase